MIKSIKNFIKQIKIRRTVKLVNRALNIKLTDWQIDFIFNNRPYPLQVACTRCNGKTLAHILRVCLKTDVKIPEPIIIDKQRIFLPPFPCNYTAKFLHDNAGADYGSGRRRLVFFLIELQKTYCLLSRVKGLKLRDIQFVPYPPNCGTSVQKHDGKRIMFSFLDEIKRG